VDTSPIEVLIFLLAVWFAIYVFTGFLNIRRYGIEVNPLYITVKTTRFNKLLTNIAERYPHFWRNYGNISIALCFIEMFLAVYLLIVNLYHFSYTPQAAVPIVPMLPGVTISLSWFPYLLIAIGFAITIHEAAHAIVASVDRVKVRSSGIVLAPVTFGGFVEPDEEDFNKLPLVSKLRTLGAGSTTNLVAGIIAFILISVLFAPESGVLVTKVVIGGPAEEAGIKEWDVIYEINGYLTRDYAEMQSVLRRINPGSIIVVKTSRACLNVVARQNPTNSSIAFIGIQSLTNFRYNPLRFGEFSTQFTYHLSTTLRWIYLIMVNLAIFNMLPLYPLDGEAFIYNILKEKLKMGLKLIRTVLNAFSLSLIGLNIALTFMKYGLTPM
jgi:membrane-associated protease RseP (regulator of RpoE activity)